jgi:ribosomal protein S19
MRSSWKHPFFLLTLNSQLKRTAHLGRRRSLRLRHRRLLVDSSMVSRFFSVPDGRGWRRLGVGPLLVGHRLGEFVRTRAKVRHYKKKRAKAQEKQRKEASKAAKAKATDSGAKTPKR